AHVAGRHVAVVAGQRADDLVGGDAERGQPLEDQLDADLADPAAVDPHRGDAGDALEPAGEELVGQVAQPARIAAAAQAEGGDRRGRDVELEDGRLLGVLRKLRAQPVERLAHVAGGGVEVGAPVELELHARQPLGRLSLQRGHPLDRRDRALDRPGQEVLDLLRPDPLVVGDDRDAREVDLGQEIDRQAGDRDAAQDADRRAQHGDADRPADRQPGDPAAHGAAAGFGASCSALSAVMVIGLPSARSTWPATSTSAPGSSAAPSGWTAARSSSRASSETGTQPATSSRATSTPVAMLPSGIIRDSTALLGTTVASSMVRRSTTTSAYIPGSQLAGGSSIRASRVATRRSRLTSPLTPVTRAAAPPVPPASSTTFSLAPTSSPATSTPGTSKRTRRGESATSLTSRSPAPTMTPGSTSRAAMRPASGARIELSTMRFCRRRRPARASSPGASALATAARSAPVRARWASSSLALTWSRSRSMRASSTSAAFSSTSARRASAAAACAWAPARAICSRASTGSISASTAPSSTVSPTRTRTAFSRPA